MNVSIIIKALNEEDNIERAIISSLTALQSDKLSGEVILADSLSTDKTVSIAKKHNIRIVQLINPKDRCCGIGPQLGYQYAKGDYLYILDGDMEIEEGFLKTAIKKLKSDKKLAGVAGKVKEMRTKNLIFQRRNESKKTYGMVDKLEMGGLYKRIALEDVGYFSNRNLHAYEEADLGLKLVAKGWSLQRIEMPAIKHYGYDTTSFDAFRRRWKTGYVKGSGEFLRSSFGQQHFFKVAWHLKVYIIVVAWYLLAIISIFTEFIVSLLLITAVGLLLFLLKKRSIKNWAFSLVSWHYNAIGLIWGFFSTTKDPKGKIEAKVIK